MIAQGADLTPEELASIRPPIERAGALPVRAFTSQDSFEIEVARVFHRRWMAVGFGATLPEPGDMRLIELVGRPLVLVRSDDGVLRAFHSICSYDGCLAVRAQQRGAKAVEVYYHGWRCDPHGRLLAAPYRDGRRRGIRPVSKGAPISSRSGPGCDSVCSSWI